VHPISSRIVERMPPRLRRPVTVLVHTVDGAIHHRLPGLAGEIAFWVLLSLPALLLTAIASVSLLGDLDGPDWQDQLVARTAEVSRLALTGSTVDSAVVPLVRQLLEGGGVGLVSFGFLTALWVASRAVRVVLTTVAIVSDREDLRPGWLNRLLGFLVTLGALVVGAVLAPLLLAGPNFGEVVEGWIDADLGVLPTVWQAAYWPTIVFVAMLAIAGLYHVAVPGRPRWRRSLPGAVLATSVWLAGSGGLRLYGAWLAQGETAYGPLAGPIVVLLWLWLTGFAVLLGGVLNAQIDHQWPDPAERRDEEAARSQEATPSLATSSSTAATRAVDPPTTPTVTPPAEVERTDEEERTVPITYPSDGPPGRRS
jgi:membrane protein